MKGWHHHGWLGDVGGNSTFWAARDSVVWRKLSMEEWLREANQKTMRHGVYLTSV